MIYYEILNDNTVGRSTNDPNVAQKFGFLFQTEQEIVYGCDGKRYLKGSEPTPPEPSYAEKRKMAYPSLEDQLDMIYWDKINGTHYWQEKIAEIKGRYPK